MYCVSVVCSCTERLYSRIAYSTIVPVVFVVLCYGDVGAVVSSSRIFEFGVSVEIILLKPGTRISFVNNFCCLMVLFTFNFK